MSKKKVGRPPVPTSEIRLKKIIELMKRENINQTELARRLNVPQQSVSRWMKSGKISEQTVQDIIEAFPEYRLEWLVGYDQIPTHREMHEINSKAISLNAPITVLYDALDEVCSCEGIEVQSFDNITELLLLEAQLKDYAVSLMWNYVKHRRSSYVWSYLDQLECEKEI